MLGGKDYYDKSDMIKFIQELCAVLLMLLSVGLLAIGLLKLGSYVLGG